MIRIDPVSDFSEEFFAAVRDEAREKLRFWYGMFDQVLRMSRNKFIGYEDEVPILGIGTLRGNLLSGREELWMLPTRYLTVFHLKDLREQFKVIAWPVFDRASTTFFARVEKESRRDAKFIEFFGGKLIQETPDWYIYEVKSCPSQF